MNLLQRAVTWCGQQCGRVVEWLIEHLGYLPTTNARIFVSLVAFVATVLVWLCLAILHATLHTVDAWTPDITMLGFLSVWAGLDALQFGVKRVTQSEYVAAKNGNGNGNGDPGPQDGEGGHP